MTKELSDLFGKPKKGEIFTFCSIAGPSGREIIKNEKITGYFLGGLSGFEIINPKGKVIGRYSNFNRSIYTLKGEETNYILGGNLGRDVLYLSKI